MRAAVLGTVLSFELFRSASILRRSADFMG